MFFSCLYTDPSVKSMIWWDIMDLLICWNDPAEGSMRKDAQSSAFTNGRPVQDVASFLLVSFE